MRKRKIKHLKHRIAKAYRRMWRTGDDWAVSSNKQLAEADRQAVKRQIRKDMTDGNTR